VLLAVVAAGKITYRGPLRTLGRNEDELEESLVNLLSRKATAAPSST
jgi:hypothetical protein